MRVSGSRAEHPDDAAVERVVRGRAAAGSGSSACRTVTFFSSPMNVPPIDGSGTTLRFVPRTSRSSRSGSATGCAKVSVKVRLSRSRGQRALVELRQRQRRHRPRGRWRRRPASPTRGPTSTHSTSADFGFAIVTSMLADRAACAATGTRGREERRRTNAAARIGRLIRPDGGMSMTPGGRLLLEDHARRAGRRWSRRWRRESTRTSGRRPAATMKKR